ncbi:MAG: large conductance mechanosensitive channel protein MscL [Gemmatimonadota bacterium]
MLKEFKDFVMRGNVMDMAIGIILGAAFGAIVSSAVNDVIMPPIGLALGGVDFSDLFANLSDTAFPSLQAAQEAGAPVIAYGTFLNHVLDFLIVALVIFLIVKQMNRLQRPAEEAPVEPTEKACPECATSIPIATRRCPNCTSQLAAA